MACRMRHAVRYRGRPCARRRDVRADGVSTFAARLRVSRLSRLERALLSRVWSRALTALGEHEHVCPSHRGRARTQLRAGSLHVGARGLRGRLVAPAKATHARSGRCGARW
jgi:hypothetical protein